MWGGGEEHPEVVGEEACEFEQAERIAGGGDGMVAEGNEDEDVEEGDPEQARVNDGLDLIA